MNNETNRLAQIIANAADKELAVRHDGQPKRQDKAAAEAIEAEYLFIRRSELPIAAIVERSGIPHVDVGSAAGTWPLGVANDPAKQRRYGLEYLVVADVMETWHAEQESVKLQNRRDELAVEIFGIPHYERIGHYSFADNHRRAIDRIIELENKAA